jgi:hypothetical protein
MGLGAPEFILVLSVLLIGGFFYFLPAILGRSRTNATAIFLLNLLLGWTAVGWIVALIWALSEDKPKVIYYNNTVSQPSPDRTDQLLKCKQLLDSGAITQDEFDKEKNRILNG